MGLGANCIVVVVRREGRIFRRSGRKIGDGIGDRVSTAERNDDSFGIRRVGDSNVATGIG